MSETIELLLPLLEPAMVREAVMRISKGVPEPASEKSEELVEEDRVYLEGVTEGGVHSASSLEGVAGGVHSASRLE